MGIHLGVSLSDLTYVTGNSSHNLTIPSSANKMPVAVKSAIQRALEIEGGMVEEEAREYIRRMEADGRLVEECWS
jgi:hypothetical protein